MTSPNQSATNQTIVNDNKSHIDIVNVCKQTVEEATANFRRDQKFSDSTLLKLCTVFGPVFERAIELNELGRIKKICAHDNHQTGCWKDIYASRYLLQIQGISGESYTIFPDIHYCPCPAFKFQVLGDQSAVTCKHLLAIWLARLTPEKIDEKRITPAQFRDLLLHHVSYE